ncbi:MAG TPA: class I SAM-dependent methyltransferase, partial [Solirubrobacteraceae bacterium]|nr:class I SAM-dependent methyltransferase [Solirubrobacteraceae bacterium]
MSSVLSAEEIRDANTRYHDVAADHYDSKWGIDFGDLGLSQVSAKVRKALGHEPGHYARSLEIGSG